MKTIHILFDGPPSHESGRFVEVEDENGNGIKVGRWEQRGDLWHLILDASVFDGGSPDVYEAMGFGPMPTLPSIRPNAGTDGRDG